MKDVPIYYEVKVVKKINWQRLNAAILKKFNRAYDRKYIDHVWKGRLPSKELNEFLIKCLGHPLEK